MIFIPATPNSELKKSVEHIVYESNLGIKVIEKSGQSLKRILQKSDHLIMLFVQISKTVWYVTIMREVMDDIVILVQHI